MQKQPQANPIAVTAGTLLCGMLLLFPTSILILLAYAFLSKLV
jgi:hypothetical protein